MNNTTFRKNMKAKFQNGVSKLMTVWEENPVLVLTVISGMAYSGAKVVDTVSSVQSRRAYAKQINRKK